MGPFCLHGTQLGWPEDSFGAVDFGFSAGLGVLRRFAFRVVGFRLCALVQLNIAKP